MLLAVVNIILRCFQLLNKKILFEVFRIHLTPCIFCFHVSFWVVCLVFLTGDGELWERACLSLVYEGSGQQGASGQGVSADGLSPTVPGEFPAHTALHSLYGWSIAPALPPLHCHHGKNKLTMLACLLKN